MAHLNLRILSDEEVALYDSNVLESEQRRRIFRGTRCTCGRFARFIRIEPNTMPHGESVTTVQCSRCGEVRIR